MKRNLIERVMAKPLLVESERQNLPKGVLCRVAYPICNIGELNANKRVYERGVWDKVMGDTELAEKQLKRNLFGHAEHPKDTTQSNLEKVSHVITKTYIDEDKNIVLQEYDVLDTPYGRIVNTLLLAECNVGVSTRAEGELQEAEDDARGKYMRVVPESYRYITTDFTADPSTFGAYPAKVEREVVNIIQKGLESNKVTQDFAVAMLESLECNEAVSLLESITETEMTSLNEEKISFKNLSDQDFMKQYKAFAKKLKSIKTIKALEGYWEQVKQYKAEGKRRGLLKECTELDAEYDSVYEAKLAEAKAEESGEAVPQMSSDNAEGKGKPEKDRDGNTVNKKPTSEEVAKQKLSERVEDVDQLDPEQLKNSYYLPIKLGGRLYGVLAYNSGGVDKGPENALNLASVDKLADDYTEADPGADIIKHIKARFVSNARKVTQDDLKNMLAQGAHIIMTDHNVDDTGLLHESIKEGTEYETEDGWNLENITPLGDFVAAYDGIGSSVYQLKNTVRGDMTLVDMRDSLQEGVTGMQDALNEIEDDDTVRDTSNGDMEESIKESKTSLVETKRRDCPECGGKGETEDGEECPTCLGDGYIEESISESTTSLVETKKTIKELQIALAEQKAVNEKALEFYNALYNKHQDTSDKYAHDAVDFSSMVDALTKQCSALEMSRERSTETVLIETKRILETKHEKNVKALNEKIAIIEKTHKAEIDTLTKTGLDISERLIANDARHRDELSVLEGKIEETEKSYKSEIEAIKEQHNKELVNKYVGCVLDFSGLQLPSQARALLEECTTEEEASDLIEKFRNALRESSVHSTELGDIAVVAENTSSPEEQKLAQRVEQVFEGIKGRK